MADFGKLIPCLWFDHEAEDAARYYVSIFPNSRVLDITHYGEAGQEIHGRKPGSVMTVDFELDGYRFTGLNGGPLFKFNEAVSFQIMCDTAEEVDHYWAKLTEGGDPNAQQCGWLKDRFGLSWQVVPKRLNEMIKDPNPERSNRVMDSMLQMKKIDVRELERVYAAA